MRYVVEADEKNLSVLGLQAATRARHGGKPDLITKSGEQLVDLAWPKTAQAYPVNVAMTPGTQESTARYHVTTPDAEQDRPAGGFRMIDGPNSKSLWLIPDDGELHVFEPVEV